MDDDFAPENGSKSSLPAEEQQVPPQKVKKRQPKGPRNGSQDAGNHPVPSHDHRYRPTIAFLTPQLTKRLTQPPQPVFAPILVSTENGSNNPAVLDRATRAWAKSYGSGPTWELIEDRCWYKESFQKAGRCSPRPLVHTALENKVHWADLDSK